MTPLPLVLTGVGLMGLGAGSALLLAPRPRLADPVFGVSVVGGLWAAGGAAWQVLKTGDAAMVTLLPSVPGGPWAMGLDPLSAWFLLVVSFVGAAATIFGIRFLAADRGRRPVAATHALLALLLAAMVMVLAARAVLLFMLAWETMALSAYLLILYEGEQRRVRRDGLLYLVITHVGALALLGMFLSWGRAGPDLTFGSLALASPPHRWGGALLLLLALFGFGGKAGVVPLHVWVPGADAAEPSHVSAVLSGVMLKMGIYGLLRVLVLLGGAPVWFGWTLFGLGLVSGVLGVLWALGERDLKRVLAYSSVENVGLIVLGLGVGTLGLAYGHPVVAVLGFTGALVHTLNHALFKSLLFLGAGAVLRATGTRVIDELGGLGRALPWTAICFGVGSVAIVGLPPLNGFVSEWVTVQGLLAGARGPGFLALLVLGVAGVGLIGALALACFSRAAGGVFLGQPRQAREVAAEDWGLVAPMLALAAGCITVGLLPRIVLGPAGIVVRSLMSALTPGGEVATAPLPAGLWAPSVLVGLLGGVAAVGWSIRRWWGGSYGPQVGETWRCAYVAPGSRMQHTAASFGRPLRLLFGVNPAVPVGRTAGARAATVERGDPAAVTAAWSRARSAAAAFRPLQQQPVTRYLQYIVLTVLVLLAVLFSSLVQL